MSGDQNPILVVGRSGQVALALARRRTIRNHEIVSFGRPELDLTDRRSLQEIVRSLRPALVINAAAYTSVDQAEREREAAFALNASGPGFLSEVCRKLACPLVHISTDYVFDGRKGAPYCETDRTGPLGVYGQSKAAGESAIREMWDGHVILRTAWIFSQFGRNFLRTMLRLGDERTTVSVVNDQIGAPTYADDLASGIAAIGERILNDPDFQAWGTYHLTGAGETSWYGFAEEIFRLRRMAGHRVPELIPVASDQYPTTARRPAYSVLDCSRAEKSFGLVLPDWRDGVRRCLAELEGARQTALGDADR